MKLNKDTPRLEEAVVFHNGVTQWTICSIMKEFTAAKRAAVIIKFIDVALVCVCMYVYVYVCIYVYYVESVCGYMCYMYKVLCVYIRMYVACIY